MDEKECYSSACTCDDCLWFHQEIEDLDIDYKER